jgi:hypothetical protein
MTRLRLADDTVSFDETLGTRTILTLPKTGDPHLDGFSANGASAFEAPTEQARKS